MTLCVSEPTVSIDRMRNKQLLNDDILVAELLGRKAGKIGNAYKEASTKYLLLFEDRCREILHLNYQLLKLITLDK